jgi:superfamily I DNA/RNA helicase
MQIESSPTAPEGSVTHKHSIAPREFVSGSAIICRNNAPLIRLLFSCVKAGRTCHMLGRDLETRLIKLIKQQRVHTGDDLKQKLYRHLEKEALTLTERKYALLKDRIQCIYYCITPGDTVTDIINRVKSIFEPTTAELTFTTIHRAKGLEWPTVYYLDAHLVPSKYATTPEALIQERNLNYVAITRAKEHLVYITTIH